MNWTNQLSRGIGGTLIMAMLAIPALAQRGPGGERGGMHSVERMEQHLDFLNDELELNEEQQSAVRKVLEAAHEEATAWMEANKDAPRSDRMAYRKEHRVQIDSAIADLLTDEQREKLESLPKDHRMGDGARGRHSFNRGDRPGLRHWNHAMGLRDLDLTDQQRDELRTLHRGHHAAVAAILSPEQRAKFEGRAKHRDRGGMHDGWSRHGARRMAKMLNLSPEQNETLKKMRQEHRAAARKWHEENPEATREERKAFRTEHREEMQSKLREVLSEEQLDTLEQMKVEREERGHHDRGAE